MRVHTRTLVRFCDTFGWKCDYSLLQGTSHCFPDLVPRTLCSLHTMNPTMGIMTHTFGQSLSEGIHGVALVCAQKVTEIVPTSTRSAHPVTTSVCRRRLLCAMKYNDIYYSISISIPLPFLRCLMWNSSRVNLLKGGVCKSVDSIDQQPA